MVKITIRGKRSDGAGKQQNTPPPADIWATEEYRNAGRWKKLRMLLKQALGNQRGEARIPDRVLCDLARALLPNITAFFESEEGKAEFEQWKKRQNGQDAVLLPTKEQSKAGRR